MLMARADLLFVFACSLAILSGCARGEALRFFDVTVDGGGGAVTPDGSASADAEDVASSDGTRQNSIGAGGMDGTVVPIEGDAEAEDVKSDSSGVVDTGLPTTEASDARPVDSGVPDAASDAMIVRSDASVVANDSGGVDSNNEVVGDASLAEAGALRPCSGLCGNPVVFITPFSSGSLGTSSTCYETTAPLQGFVCGNFGALRMLAINGAVVPCDGVARSPGPARNGGFCFQATAGIEMSEYFNTY